MKANRLMAIMGVVFLFLFLNLVRMQVIQTEHYQSLSERNRIRVIYLEGPRGRILDRNGEILADNRLSFNCSVVLNEANTTIFKSSRLLAPLLDMDPAALEKQFLKKRRGAFNSILIAEDITPAQAMAIEERLDFLPGFMIETRPLREYPYAESAAHLVGYIGPMAEDESEELEFYGYKERDWLGRDGVEKNYESYLRGHSGGLQIEVDSRGRFIRALGVKEPAEGKDIRLTVDARLQSYAQGLLQAQKGAVIIMELKEGGLLAINSSPSFDPNLFASNKGRKEVRQYLIDPLSPMVDRGVRGQYPPGSIFKIITALSALQNHGISPATSFNCPGYLIVGGKVFHCWKEGGHGPQSLAQAFAHSCNVYFYKTGLAAGIDALFAKAIEFGYSKPTGVDLPGEKEGFVPSREWKRQAFQAPWYEGETANLAIGQGYLQVTPIQALLMIAAVATKGELFKPHVIDRIEGMKVAEKHTRSLNIPLEDWKAVCDGLDQVINSDTGTGRLARLPDIRVSGKTGTAQSGQDKTHAWFVGFAPEENPKIAMVVFLEHGGRGGVNAATVASALFRWLKEASYL